MCEKVKLTNSNTEIGLCIVALAAKKNKESCYQCFKEAAKECETCLSHWYNGRNATIQVLRNVFELPSGKDVPKHLYYLAASEADNITNGVVSENFSKFMNKLRKLHQKGILAELVPEDKCCPSCAEMKPPSRLGYTIYGPEPVCWDCDLKRGQKVA